MSDHDKRVLKARVLLRRARERLALCNEKVAWHRAQGVEDNTEAMQVLFWKVEQAQVDLDVAMAHLENLIGVQEGD
jgi:hypothetical protein